MTDRRSSSLNPPPPPPQKKGGKPPLKKNGASYSSPLVFLFFLLRFNHRCLYQFDNKGTKERERRTGLRNAFLSLSLSL